ncbi:MAG: hypothetical protein HOP23_03265 [Methylococcaceae bacterium]|nr:hypothetical protein [Methylococcaceae bacterium]
MAKNNLPIWCRENFSVRPEPFDWAQESLVEGWTEKFHSVAASHSCFDKLSTNGLPGDFAFSGSYF